MCNLQSLLCGYVCINHSVRLVVSQMSALLCVNIFVCLCSLWGSVVRSLIASSILESRYVFAHLRLPVYAVHLNTCYHTLTGRQGGRHAHLKKQQAHCCWCLSAAWALRVCDCGMDLDLTAEVLVQHEFLLLLISFISCCRFSLTFSCCIGIQQLVWWPELFYKTSIKCSSVLPVLLCCNWMVLINSMTFSSLERVCPCWVKSVKGRK